MGWTITVIDHDAAILDSMRLVLEQQGWGVETWSRGEAFLTHGVFCKPDCVILEPHLPGPSGADIARSLRSRHGDVPIIGLTTRPVSPSSLDLIESGARLVLLKPVSAEELLYQVWFALNPDQYLHDPGPMR